MRKLIKNENAPQIVDVYENNKVNYDYENYMKVKIQLIESIIRLIEKI